MTAAFDEEALEIPEAEPSRVWLVPSRPGRLRKRAVRAKTVNLERLSLRDRAVARAAEPDDGKRRLPMTRGDCVDGPRPCPFVSCRHHLLLDVEGDGSSLKINFPDLIADDEVRLDEMPATCALDVADHGGTTLDHVGEIMNVTRERIRQIEERLLAKLAARHPDRLGRAGAGGARS